MNISVNPYCLAFNQLVLFLRNLEFVLQISPVIVNSLSGTVLQASGRITPPPQDTLIIHLSNDLVS